MMQSIGVAEGAMHDGAVAAKQARDDIGALVARLRTDVDESHASWAASSGDAVRALVDEWMAEMNSLAGGLDALASSLLGAERDQIATEGGATRGIAGLQKLMGAF
ncbi:WXG100 family type VII secretion target [Leifsonia sp. ZF2019]|uniref:WXG100 family type VII secretion target n=1 Tax=Leifsonia sp. ZF2019 TaxID=2781978 RepID=UPI001CBA9DE3|nr:WXG100 family type VII secretion target [Leifsonia sp. ZF2019]UAJ78770.1 WXG100 family type VII secretion target [Leifsonia sp. ZF2019]